MCLEGVLSNVSIAAYGWDGGPRVTVFLEKERASAEGSFLPRLLQTSS